jgi:flagellar assembly protein FliH
MSNPAIPKEQLTAYERWELPNFGSTGMHDSASIGCQDNPDISLPTAAELEAIQRQAHEEGYQAGYAEGYQTGNAEGTQAGNTETSRRCTELMDSMAQALQQADQEIAQDLLKLSLEVARQMVQQTLKTNPEILLNIIREAISSLPHFNQGAHLVLHPDDATMFRTSMGEQLSHSGWKIFEDAQLARGGARVETAHSQIDATVANRWHRIVAAIGQDSSWIQIQE